MNRLNHPSFDRRYRGLVFSCGVAFLLLFWMCFSVNYYLAARIYDGAVYRFLIPVLFGCYLAAHGLRDGAEVRILLAYWLWAVLTRILNGDHTLTESLPRILDLTLVLLCFLPGLVLNGKNRERFFDLFALLVTVYFFILGILSVYAAVSGRVLQNPLDEGGTIGYYRVMDSIDRLFVLGLHPNSAAGKFLISFCLLVYLFLKKRNPVFRAWTVVAAAVDYVVIALTLSRNGQSFQSLCLALAVGILLLTRMRGKRLWQRGAALLLALLVITPLAYQGYEPVRHAVWLARESSSSGRTDPFYQQPMSYNPDKRENDNEYQADGRGYFESGRTEIYRSALISLKEEPRRLLFGSSYEHYMDISHRSIEETALNFHNMLLEVVNLFGLPGLALVIWFYLLLGRRMLRLLFGPGSEFTPAQKMLVLPVIGMSGHFMLEAGAFTDMNFRVGVLFFVSGMVTGLVRGAEVRSPRNIAGEPAGFGSP